VQGTQLYDLIVNSCGPATMIPLVFTAPPIAGNAERKQLAPGKLTTFPQERTIQSSTICLPSVGRCFWLLASLPRPLVGVPQVSCCKTRSSSHRGFRTVILIGISGHDLPRSAHMVRASSIHARPLRYSQITYSLPTSLTTLNSSGFASSGRR
jgi:hypothetical protein